MINQDFTTTILVDKSPTDAFNAINNPRAWWGKEIEGRTDRLGDEWTYRYKDMHYSKQKTIELIPDKKVTWRVVDATISFLEDKTEWNDTKIVFDIADKGGKTEVRFTHVGLAPDVECFEVCSSAWGGLITSSLRNLIELGEGDPDNLD
jgi:hypothetical protein